MAESPAVVARDTVFLRTLVVAIVAGALLAVIAWWLAGLAMPEVRLAPRAAAVQRA